VRRAIKLMLTLIAATAISGGSAVYAVAVSVPTDDFSVNLGFLLQAGHRYRFYEWENVSTDTSSFGIPEAELRLYGSVFETVDYDLRLRGFSVVREAYVGTELLPGFSAKVGEYFVPFGVEATTEEGYLLCTSPALSSDVVAPGREPGLRFDYVRQADNWPYEFGAAAGVYNNNKGAGPLVDGAARVYARPVPGAKTLSIGCSFYYRKEYREIFDPRRRTVDRPFRPAPRLAGDVYFNTWRLRFGAEYLEYLISDILIGARGGELVYKDDYYRGGFATVSYAQPLPWRYFGAVEPYLRYERYDPPVFDRGWFPEDRYTGGFALYFIGRNLMFKADYTRILEEEQRRTNDEIESFFQVMF
jgi:hypothetical protein